MPGSDESEGFDLDAFWAYARASGEFDDEFLDRMDRARAEGKVNAEIASRRPPLAVLGKLLDHHLDVVIATLALRRLEAMAALEQLGDLPESLDDDAWWPAPRSCALDDLTRLAAEGWDAPLIRDDEHDDCSRVVRTARRLVEAAVDHLRAIAVLVQDGRSVRASLALTRVAIDASAHLHHLLPHKGSAADRLIHALNEDLVVLSEAVREAERSGQDRPIEEEDTIESLLDGVSKSLPQIHASWPPKDRPNGSRLGRVPFVGEFVGTSAMVDDALDVTGGQIWADLSAVVHNQESGVFRVTYSLELSRNVQWRERNIAIRIFAALYVLERAFRRLGSYMGWNLTDLFDNGLLNAWAIGAGLADDHIREQVLREQRGE